MASEAQEKKSLKYNYTASVVFTAIITADSAESAKAAGNEHLAMINTVTGKPFKLVSSEVVVNDAQ